MIAHFSGADTQTAPSGIVFVIDGESKLITGLRWESIDSGEWGAIIEDQILIRRLGLAEEVSVTILGYPASEARFKAEELTVFRNVTREFDVGHFGSASVVPPSNRELGHPSPGPTTGVSPTQERADQAGQLCRDALYAGAKDPTSIRVDDRYKGQPFGRNQIYITFDFVGRNAFGAVLWHSWGCIVSCPKDKSCRLLSAVDTPY